MAAVGGHREGREASRNRNQLRVGVIAVRNPSRNGDYEFSVHREDLPGGDGNGCSLSLVLEVLCSGVEPEEAPSAWKRARHHGKVFYQNSGVEGGVSHRGSFRSHENEFYLKSNFGFGKDQYTLAQMIIGGVSIFLKVVGYPVLASFSGERTILLISLMGIAASNFLYSISWAPWVAYLCGGLGALAALFLPASGSVTTIAAGSDEQGKVQGLLASTNKLAGVISPIVVTPLTAAFFSDNPPFNFPGLPFMIGGIAVVVAMAFVLVLPSEQKPATQTSQYLLANEEENSVAGN